jgi:hypothetical protein
MLEFVKGMHYFKNLNALKVKGLINSLNKLDFLRGNIVIKEGAQQLNDDVFFILEGEFAEIQTFQLEDNHIG